MAALGTAEGGVTEGSLDGTELGTSLPGTGTCSPPLHAQHALMTFFPLCQF